MENNILRIEHLTMQFGGVVAVNDLSMEINRGEIVALIGPNGAGKTTAFNCVTGVYEPTNGQILFCGRQIARSSPSGKMRKIYAGNDASAFVGDSVRLSPDHVTKLGIARTFQNIRLFSGMTVFDNVLTAKHLRRKSNFLTSTLHLNYAEEKRMREETRELLKAVHLLDVADEMATSLPYGKQRLLEIARALATKPTLLLLDEPAAGMNPQETEELSAFIRHIKDEFQLTIFIIEHHMNLVMDISDRIYVIDFGRLIASGVPDEIQNNPAVIALKGISIQVEKGEIVTLIGANGAGKSTTLRAISGLVPIKTGTITYDGSVISGQSPQKIVSEGICMVPEGRRVFPNLTVLENLRIGAYLRKDDIQPDIDHVYQLFPRLKERSWQLAGTLSGGEQQMLAVGRALMMRPKLLMMDEPSLGLAPLVIRDIFSIIRTLHEEGITILLVEQNANAALRVADSAYVLETGSLGMHGTGEELLNDPRVKDAYLGKAAGKNK